MLRNIKNNIKFLKIVLKKDNKTLNNNLIKLVRAVQNKNR